ncbi:hypothetical protein [Vibrio rhodolitus]|uniref:hypothetical protein n=1 Tax=Vibrio rhodolitus TaxID=2231649 RepID=UPI000E0A9CD3|nr:hypothetical protein [Vibrio rhodolitus]
MNVEYNQLVETLKSWGATQVQVDAILPPNLAVGDMADRDSKQRQRLIESIDESLKLLFPNKERRKHFMSHSSNTVFFAQRKPLDVLALGSLANLEQSYQSIRSMLCI